MKKIISNKNNLQVLFEDNHIIAINKRCGDIIQGDKTGDNPLSEIVKSFLKTKYSKPGNVYLGIPHRLDRPTSGVVIFAKTSKCLSRLNKLFKEGKVQIIDEFTGRILSGRRFSDGLHQAIEAKENVNIQEENQTLASITYQNYFRLYNKLAGMTGTAMTESE